MTDNDNSYLPIGSVVQVKELKFKLMIIGYCKNISADKQKNNDYIACIYPAGLLNLKETLAFKKEQIEQILFTGYKDQQYDIFNKFMNFEKKAS